MQKHLVASQYETWLLKWWMGFVDSIMVWSLQLQVVAYFSPLFALFCLIFFESQRKLVTLEETKSSHRSLKENRWLTLRWGGLVALPQKSSEDGTREMRRCATFQLKQAEEKDIHEALLVSFFSSDETTWESSGWSSKHKKEGISFYETC